ncbi:hypothetical protein [Bifidobacterium gallicum]|nr:hypothetical protein [Bifidobacterium gallicum]KFI57907.1 putative transposase [Bifidobacterium gallicum DSM 20093 = LMG 11596]
MEQLVPEPEPLPNQEAGPPQNPALEPELEQLVTQTATQQWWRLPDPTAVRHTAYKTANPIAIVNHIAYKKT